MIKNEINTIVKESKLRKNDSQQNILIVKKILDLYNLSYNKIEDLYLYDFNNLLQNIIEKDYPIKIANEVLKIIRSLIEEDKLLDSYLEYLLKITLICCINIVGGS